MTDDQKSAAAFNLWMLEFSNDPEAFESTTAAALKALRERISCQEPTYGQAAAATYAAYLERVTAEA